MQSVLVVAVKYCGTELGNMNGSGQIQFQTNTWETRTSDILDVYDFERCNLVNEHDVDLGKPLW